MQDLNNNNSQKHIEDFNTVFNIYTEELSHLELINLIKNGSDVEKQAGILKLERINSQKEAMTLINNLTGCDGKIREAVSFKLKSFILENPDFFADYDDIFLEAIIDINGNICRNVISAIGNLKTNNLFVKNFCPKLIEMTKVSVEKVKSFNIQAGKYRINKEIFKLYWYLETIYEFSEFISTNDLSSILTATKDIEEYTIREKTAKILSKIKKNEELLNLQKDLRNDQNYYVRRF